MNTYQKATLAVFVLIVLVRLIFFAPMIDVIKKEGNYNCERKKVTAPIWTLGVIEESHWLIGFEGQTEREFNANRFGIEVAILSAVLLVLMGVFCKITKKKNKKRSMTKIVVHFDFDDKRIDELKEEAKKLGIDMYDLIENKLNDSARILGANWSMIDYMIT